MNLIGRVHHSFATDDVELAVSLFAEDGEYDQFNGQVAKGRDKIREVLAPQFQHLWGEMRFAHKTEFANAAAGTMGTIWTATMTLKGEQVSFDGIDVFHCKDGKLQRKETYTKARKALLSSEYKVL
ncbi:MAG: nuclear transport factor 2 family protein [Chromatiales bacterium]|nr:nuclear transport factor 2 family protein [Chromatiales bacterium]